MAILITIKCDSCDKKIEIDNIEDYATYSIRYGIDDTIAVYKAKPLVITTWYDKDDRKFKDNHFCCYECKRDYDKRIARGQCIKQI